MSNMVQLSIDLIRVTIEKRIVQLKHVLELDKATGDIPGGLRTEGAIEELEFFVKHLPQEKS